MYWLEYFFVKQTEFFNSIQFERSEARAVATEQLVAVFSPLDLGMPAINI